MPDSVLEVIQNVCGVTGPSNYQFKLKQKFHSESVSIRSQINELLEILKENVCVEFVIVILWYWIRNVKSTDSFIFQGSNFIRCVRPNGKNLQGFFDENYVLEQLRNTGTLSLVANESNVLKRRYSVHRNFHNWIIWNKFYHQTQLRTLSKRSCFMCQYLPIPTKRTKIQKIHVLINWIISLILIHKEVQAAVKFVKRRRLCIA